jgi:hypothetical protein
LILLYILYMRWAGLLGVVADILLLPITLWLGMWLRWREARILREGARLTPAQQRLAIVLGVQRAENVRILSLPSVPLPLPRWARVAAENADWLSRHIAGMTLGHGIVLRDDFCQGGVGDCDARLLAHELAHVAQFERLGGCYGFLRQYVRECVWPGYPRGALEREARAAEQSDSTLEKDVIRYASTGAR